MKIDYEKYIRRLQEKRSNSPYIKAFQQSQSANALTQRSIDQQLSGKMGMRGFSAGSIAQMAQNRDEASRARTGQMWAETADKDALRNEQIDSRIESLEIQREEQDERIRKEAQDKKNSLLKTALQVGGAAVGGLAGLAFANPMLGTQIGGAGGQMLGSFIGGDGKMSTRNFSQDEFVSGIQDVTSSISSALTLKNQRNSLSGLTEAIKGKNLSSKDLLFLSEYLKVGDLDGARKYLSDDLVEQLTDNTSDWDKFLRLNGAR